MRAIWKGHLDVGLLSIPVRLYPAVVEDLSFRLLHKTDLAPVRIQRVCSKDGQVLNWNEIVKGYEHAPGEYTPVEPEEFERARSAPADTRDITVLEFVGRGDIDPVFFSRPYLLAPAEGGERAFTVLREAMVQEERAALVRLAIRQRPRLAALYPEDHGLALLILRTPEELHSVDELKIPARRVSREEIAMARALVDRMSAEWVPEEFRDEYRSRLRTLIARKVPRAVPTTAGAEPSGIELVEILRRSLAPARIRQRQVTTTQPRTHATTATTTRRATAAKKPATVTRKRQAR